MTSSTAGTPSGAERAARRRREGARSQVTGETGGPETLREGARQEPTDPAARRAATPGRRLLSGTHGLRSRRSRCRCSPRPIGAARACTRAAISRVFCARAPAEMARSARRHSLHAFLQQLRHRTCRSAFSDISSRARRPAGSGSRAFVELRRPGETFTLRAENEWPLARTQWTKYYLDPGMARPLDRCADGRGDAHLRSDG